MRRKVEKDLNASTHLRPEGCVGPARELILRSAVRAPAQRGDFEVNCASGSAFPEDSVNVPLPSPPSDTHERCFSSAGVPTPARSTQAHCRLWTSACGLAFATNTAGRCRRREMSW